VKITARKKYKNNKKIYKSADKMLQNGRSDEKFNEFCEKPETLERILQREFDDPELRIIKIDCMRGSKDGDNYMSLIKRIIVKYRTGKSAGEILNN
jgi:hypothetical protein